MTNSKGVGWYCPDCGKNGKGGIKAANDHNARCENKRKFDTTIRKSKYKGSVA